MFDTKGVEAEARRRAYAFFDGRPGLRLNKSEPYPLRGHCVVATLALMEVLQERAVPTLLQVGTACWRCRGDGVYLPPVPNGSDDLQISFVWGDQVRLVDGEYGRGFHCWLVELESRTIIDGAMDSFKNLHCQLTGGAPHGFPDLAIIRTEAVGDVGDTGEVRMVPSDPRYYGERYEANTDAMSWLCGKIVAEGLATRFREAIREMSITARLHQKRKVQRHGQEVPQAAG